MRLQIDLEGALLAASANRESHISEYGDAMKKWGELVDEAAVDLRGAVDNDPSKASLEKLQDLFRLRPRSNLPEYDRVISAFSIAISSGQSTVEMSAEEVDEVFNDNWDWRQQSKHLNSSYFGG